MTAKITLPSARRTARHRFPCSPGSRWYGFQAERQETRPGPPGPPGGYCLHRLVFGDTGIDNKMGTGLITDAGTQTPQANAFNQRCRSGPDSHPRPAGALPSPPETMEGRRARFLAPKARCAGLRRRRAPALRRLCH